MLSIWPGMRVRVRVGAYISMFGLISISELELKKSRTQVSFLSLTWFWTNTVFATIITWLRSLSLMYMLYMSCTQHSWLTYNTFPQLRCCNKLLPWPWLYTNHSPPLWWLYAGLSLSLLLSLWDQPPICLWRENICRGSLLWIISNITTLCWTVQKYTSLCRYISFWIWVFKIHQKTFYIILLLQSQIFKHPLITTLLRL